MVLRAIFVSKPSAHKCWPPGLFCFTLRNFTLPDFFSSINLVASVRPSPRVMFRVRLGLKVRVKQACKNSISKANSTLGILRRNLRVSSYTVMLKAKINRMLILLY